MGCFGCFGRRKNRRRQSRRESFQPRLNRISDGSMKDVSFRVPVVEEVPKLLNLKVSSVVEVSKITDDHLSFEQVPKISVIPIINKAEEKQSPCPSLSPVRKRVTFDSNVKTYEHIVVEESVEFFEEKKDDVKLRRARCLSEGSDVTSNSSGSYSSNHRYQNCRESDDEEEVETECDDESDLEDIDHDDDELLHEDYYVSDIYEDKLNNWDKEVYTEEIDDHVMDIEKTNASARDRSGYVNAVLNPIENLSQWKAVKSKGRRTTIHTQSRKENTINASSFSLEPQIDNELSSSSSSSSSSSLFSLNLKSRDDEVKKQRTQEVAVDASLSTWLSTSQTTEEKKKYSKPVQSYDERPILGALTTEEIKQFSATNSPRKSPCKSPESPIIGTVGGYWNNHSMTTSKYSRSS